jgi:hypothetical protein
MRSVLYHVDAGHCEAISPGEWLAEGGSGGDAQAHASIPEPLLHLIVPRCPPRQTYPVLHTMHRTETWVLAAKSHPALVQPWRQPTVTLSELSLRWPDGVKLKLQAHGLISETVLTRETDV